MAGRMKTTFGNPCWKGSSFPLNSTIVMRSDFVFIRRTPRQKQTVTETKDKSKCKEEEKKRTGTKFSTDFATVNIEQRHLVTIAIVLRVSGRGQRSVSEQTSTIEMSDVITLFGYEMTKFTRTTSPMRMNDATERMSI